VPVHLVASAGEEIRLRCATAEFAELEHVEETQLLPGASGQMGLRRRADRLVAVHGLGMGGMGTGGMGLGT
jgi:hypothetical protein